MNEDPLDTRQVRRAFARAATSYERHDALQREVAERLLERLDYYEGEPGRVLDIGCGTGRGSARLRKRWPRAQVVALDSARAMLRVARRHAGWRHPFARVCGDAAALPLADHCMDIVYSNLCLPWCGAPRPLFREMVRVLKPGGLLVASSLGPDTLRELRGAWAEADPDWPHVGTFADMHVVGDAALAAGIKDPVLDTGHIRLEYRDVRPLLDELKGLGATNADRDRRRGLTGRGRFAALAAAYPRDAAKHGVAATCEVVTLHGWGPPKGFLPRYGGRETPFEVIRRREPRAPRD